MGLSLTGGGGAVGSGGAAFSGRIAGDSFSSLNNTVARVTSGVGTTGISNFPGYWNFVDWRTYNAISSGSVLSPVENKRYGTNSGITGIQMPAFITNLPALLAAMNAAGEKHLIINIGTNDIQNARTLSAMNADFLTITNTVLAAGINPVWTTITPRNTTDPGSNGWNATGTSVAQKKQQAVDHNLVRTNYCTANNIRMCDWYAAFGGGTDDAITGYTTDKLHPSGIGSYAMSTVMIATLAGLITPVAPVYNPVGNALNGALTGTGGATANGGGTGTVGGVIPDNWRLNKVPSTTTSVSLAIVPRTDGQPGNVAEFTFTATGGGLTSEAFRFEYFVSGSAALVGFGLSGDICQATAEIEYVAGHGGIIRGAWPRLAMATSVTKVGTTVSFDSATNTINDSANGFGNFVANRYIQVAGAAQAGNNKAFKVVSVTAGTITVDPSTAPVTEAAGNNVTVTLPAPAAGNGNSTVVAPDLDTPVMLMHDELEIPYTGNMAPRIEIQIDGTKTGTGKVRVGLPALRKIARPAYMNFLADD